MENQAIRRHHKQKPQKRRKGDTPIGYLGRTALKREQCDVTVESQSQPSIAG
jgi:hypothetical protein